MSDRKKNSLILGVGSLTLGVLWGLSVFVADIVGCPFKMLTGIPCPGCGGMRAFDLLLHGRVLDALLLNPLSVLVIAFLAVSGVWILVDIVRDSRTWLDFMHRKWSGWVVAVIVGVIVLNWGWNIYKGL